MTAGSDTRPLRVGLLGCGRIARRYHLPILASLPGVAVDAVAEQDAVRREACRGLAPSATWFEHYRELLAATELDAAVICLPPALHAEAAIACLERSLHIYLEKPVAMALDEGQAVIRAWRQAGTIAWTGFNFRFHPLAIDMRDALGRGAVGDVMGAQASFCASGRNLPAWKSRRSSGGGALLDLASHQFDLIRFVTGQEIVEVGSLIRSHASEEDCVSVQLRLFSGVPVTVFSALGAAEQHRLEVIGCNGRIEFDRYYRSRLQFMPAQRDFGKSARACAAASSLAGFPRMLRDRLWPPREMSFADAISAFVRSVRGDNVPGPDLDDGLRSLAVVLAAEQAARKGRWVAVEAGC